MCVPVPQANVHCLLHLKSCPDPQCALSAARLPASEPGPQVRVAGFVRMLSFRDRTSRWHRTAQNSQTRANPRPQPELPVTVLKIHLQKEPQPHTRELMNHVFLSKYHRNESVLIQGPPPPPQPSPSYFSSIRARTVPASRAEGNLRVVLPGAFFLMKEITHVGGDVPSATE